MKLTRENVDYIQSACNPLAVARQFYEWCQEIKDETNNLNAIQENDLLAGVLGKLCDMFHISHDGERAYRYMQTLEKNNYDN